MQEADVKANSNVYAELGSTWRFLATRDPDSTAHALGKLFKYIGEDNVLWGTDSVWYGSPQDQIQAFRTFQIAEHLRDQHGYPRITPQLRAKVFGLNATRPYQLAAARLERFTRAMWWARSRVEMPDPNPSTRTTFAHAAGIFEPARRAPR